MSITSETDRIVTACANTCVRSIKRYGDTGMPNSTDAHFWWNTLTAEERRLFDGPPDLLMCVKYRARRLAEGAA